LARIRYLVAASLDGYIAGPKGEIDWIPMDPDFDFGAIYRQFDVLLAGRRTFEEMAKNGPVEMPGMKTFVFSQSLQRDHPKVTIVAGPLETAVASLREKAKKDIWLFGGGALFRSFAEAGLVDTVEVSVVPVLLGGGTPLLPGPSGRTTLKLNSHRVYKSGIVSLEYSIIPRSI
jgi:dihydrofolate reductase